MSRGKGYPKKVLAGKIQQSQTASLPEADEFHVLRVALAAFERGEEPADVWAQVAQGTV